MKMLLINHQILIFLQVFFVYIFQIKCDSDPSIIIIGAGASGIAAATKLLKNNITNLKILEAEDRIGGRIHSVKFGDAIVDLGAEYCHGETNNIVYDMVKDLNILKRSKKVDLIAFSFDGAEISARLREKITNLLEALINDDNNNTVCESFKSVGDCLDSEFEKLMNSTSRFGLYSERESARKVLNRTKIWLHNAVAGYDSPLDLHDLSTRNQFEESGGDLHLSWNGLGFKTILDILMGKYPATATPLPIDDKILLNKEVSKISKWDEEGQVEVMCKDGTTYKADVVVFSPSLGVLKADHHKLFEPSLPQEKIDAIENIGFGVVMKIFMEFSQNYTLKHDLLATLFRADQFDDDSTKELDWLEALTALVPAPNNPRVILGWYAGKEVPRIEALTDSQIFEGQEHIFYQFLRGHRLPKLTNIIRSKWLTNPHFKGSYSYESVKGAEKGRNWYEDMAKPLLNNNKPVVLFMGEATNPKHYATVHGAIETGFREAQRIIDSLKK